jgi:hypothetical protein
VDYRGISDWLKMWENFLLDRILNLEEKYERNLYKACKEMELGDYNEIFPSVSKLLLNSKNSEFRVTGLRILKNCRMETSGVDASQTILEQFLRDDKPIVQEFCVENILLNSEARICALCGILQNSPSTISEICRIRLKSCEFDEKMVEFILSHMGDDDRIVFHLDSLISIVSIWKPSLSEKLTSNLITSLCKTCAKPSPILIEKLSSISKGLNGDHLITHLQSIMPTANSDILEVIHLLSCSCSKISISKFETFILYLHSLEPRILASNKQILSKILYSIISPILCDILIQPLVFFIIKHEMESLLPLLAKQNKINILNTHLYAWINEIKPFFAKNIEWKTLAPWIPSNLHFVISNLDPFEIPKDLIPILVKLTGDWEIPTKVKVFSTISKILTKCEKSQILFYDQVFFKLVHDNMIYRDIEIYDILLPTTNTFLSLCNSEKFFDVIVDDLLTSCIYVTTHQQRNCILTHLSTLISNMGIDFCKFFKRFFQIISSPEFTTPNSIDFTINIINTTNKVCWPRITSDRKKHILSLLPQEKQNFIFFH